jgi:hypothetical protein
VITTWIRIVCVERVTAGEIDALLTMSRAGGASCAIGIALLPGGQPLEDTIPVGAEVAWPAPLVLCAVTVTRSV